MFDLKKQLRLWRQETEATLAFEPEEIDELEDHLRLSLERNLKEGMPPQEAWTRSLAHLGPSPSLAPEFAKSKLMPALIHLFRSWFKPGLLLILLPLGLQIVGTSYADGPWVVSLLSWISLVTILVFLPDKQQKNALLLGIGNAFCLLPLLHNLFYNNVTGSIIRLDWFRLVPAFGVPVLMLSLTCLVTVNLWWWKRSAGSENRPAMLAIAAALVFVITIAPSCGGFASRLSDCQINQLPDNKQVAAAGAGQGQLIRKREVIISHIIYTVTGLPCVLTLMTALGIIGLQGICRLSPAKKTPSEVIFPAPSDLPWIMTLMTSGGCWIYGSLIEPGISGQARTGDGHFPDQMIASPWGVEMMVLFPALIFLICFYELTLRLHRSPRIRSFYASLVTGSGLFTVCEVTFPPAIPSYFDYPAGPFLSAQPVWLSWILGGTVLLFAAAQILVIKAKLRQKACEPSLWSWDGNTLVQQGALLGLILACSAMALWLVNVIIFYLTFLRGWGTGGTVPYDPAGFRFQDLILATGPAYLCFCLLAGLGVVIILSALEFIRFNSYRYYKMKKAGKLGAAILTGAWRT